MKLKNPAFYTTLINALIIVLIGVVVWKTNNALALFGLMLLQSTPIIDPTQIAAIEAMGVQTDDEDDAKADDHTIGFLARLK